MCENTVSCRKSSSIFDERLIHIQRDSEYDDASKDPDRVTIKLTDRGETLIISYKNTHLLFNMVLVKDVDGLVNNLVNSFRLASDK